MEEMKKWWIGGTPVPHISLPLKRDDPAATEILAFNRPLSTSDFTSSVNIRVACDLAGRDRRGDDHGAEVLDEPHDGLCRHHPLAASALPGTASRDIGVRRRADAGAAEFRSGPCRNRAV